MRLWTNFRKISIAEFKKVYERLGIKFDTYLGESYFAGETDKIVEECLLRRLAPTETAGKVGAPTKASEEKSGKNGQRNRRDRGGRFDGLPSFLLRKKDDSGLYITRDLAALIFRTEVFKPDEIIYVVGDEQSLHFRQLFALARALGYIDGANVKHIGFGLVLSDGEKCPPAKAH